MSELDKLPQEPGAYTHIIVQLKRFWYLGLIAAAVAGSIFVWWRFFAMTDEDYKPLQPIAYSHKLHAGDLKIPCTYCHFNAEKSNHAGVPPLSVCLGCHSPEKGAVANDRPEMQKFLSLTVEADQMYSSADDGDNRDSATMKTGGMVHWNRVHQLPDHVYFPHKWHVQAGVSCQTCHGAVETMEVVKQEEDLTMGWCIRCHRKDDYVSYNTQRSGLHNAYDADDARSFVVGTGNYDVLRHNVRPDDLPVFTGRAVKAPAHDAHDAHAEKAEAHTEAHAELAEAHGDGQKLRGMFLEDRDENDKEKILNVDYFTLAQAEKLKSLFKKYPDLPRWRISDLPETHQAFYGTDMDKGQHQNAPTQCSTCHQ